MAIICSAKDGGEKKGKAQKGEPDETAVGNRRTLMVNV